MKTYCKKLNDQLGEMVVQVRSALSRNDRAKFNTMLIIDVHARDIVEFFVRDSITSAREFEWESQLRFYWSQVCYYDVTNPATMPSLTSYYDVSNPATMTSLTSYYDVSNPATMTSLTSYYDVTNPATMTSLILLL